MIKWLMSFFKKQEVVEGRGVLIWAIIEGPFGVDEIEGTEGYPEGSCMIVAKVQDGEDLVDAEVWLEDFNAAYAIKKHFDKKIEPIYVEVDVLRD